jgi:cell division protein FtsX
MTRFLGVLVVLLACVAALGFYLGWFHVSTVDTDHKANVTVTVDKEKFHKDVESAKEKVQDIGHKVEEKTGAETTDEGGSQKPRP